MKLVVDEWTWVGVNRKINITWIKHGLSRDVQLSRYIHLDSHQNCPQEAHSLMLFRVILSRSSPECVHHLLVDQVPYTHTEAHKVLHGGSGYFGATLAMGHTSRML